MQNIRCQVPAGGILAQHFAEVPSHLFYPGILLMKITWVQSQMVRLLVLSEKAALRRVAISPAQLWYDSSPCGMCGHDRLKECHRPGFSKARQSFHRPAFTLTQDEITALHCLVCMRNMLAHAALSPTALTEERSAPVANYYPLQPQHKDCGKCPGFPDAETAAQGIILSFDAATVAGYLADVDTVTAALQRIAASMGLAYIDLQ